MGRVGFGESDLHGGEGVGEAGAGGSRASVGGPGAAGSRGHGDGALLAQAIGGTREAGQALTRQLPQHNIGLGSEGAGVLAGALEKMTEMQMLDLVSGVCGRVGREAVG